MNSIRFLAGVLAGVLGMTIGGTASLHAQAGGGLSVASFTIGSGGGSSAGGRFSLTGTAGQRETGTLAPKLRGLQGGSFSVEAGFWHRIQLVPTPDAPILKMRLIAGQQVVISWPIDAAGWLLQECHDLAVGNWTPVATGIVDTRDEHTVTVPAAGLVRCYRLIKTME